MLCEMLWWSDRLKRDGWRDRECVVKTESHSSCLQQHWLRVWLSVQCLFLLKCYSTKSCEELGQLSMTSYFTSGYQERWMYVSPQHPHFYCHSSKIEISCTTAYSLWLNFLLPKQPIRNTNGQNQFHNKTVRVLYHRHIILNFCWFCLQING